MTGQQEALIFREFEILKLETTCLRSDITEQDRIIAELRSDRRRMLDMLRCEAKPRANGVCDDSFTCSPCIVRAEMRAKIAAEEAR